MAYPLFGHSWSAQTQEVALVAWPYDYLEAGVEPDEENSQWSPILDTPGIQGIVQITRDGRRVSQYELTQQAKKRKPSRLFLLKSSGEFLELLETARAHHPQWSPDGRVLIFRQRVKHEDVINLILSEGLERRSVAPSGASPDLAVHPDGVLFYTTRIQSGQDRALGWQIGWQHLLLERSAIMLHV